MRILLTFAAGILLVVNAAVADSLQSESRQQQESSVSLTGAANLGASAQSSSMTTSRAVIRPTTVGTQPGQGLVGLLKDNGLFDPEKLTTWRSYSFEMATGGGQTTSAGLLVQHMHYQFSQPLSLYMEVGLLHDPLGAAGVTSSSMQQTASVVIPNLDLIYRPTENMTLQFHFSQGTQGYYSSPWGFAPYGEIR